MSGYEIIVGCAIGLFFLSAFIFVGWDEFISKSARQRNKNNKLV